MSFFIYSTITSNLTIFVKPQSTVLLFCSVNNCLRWIPTLLNLNWSFHVLKLEYYFKFNRSVPNRASRSKHSALVSTVCCMAAVSLSHSNSPRPRARPSAAMSHVIYAMSCHEFPGPRMHAWRLFLLADAHVIFILCMSDIKNTMHTCSRTLRACLGYFHT